MPFIIAGLGNPGEEYDSSRHNVGRIMLEKFSKAHDFSDWEKNKKLNALESVGKVGKTGKVGKDKTTLILPETFMNRSGLSLKPLITSVKKAASLVVVYDDLDLPLGKVKISFNRGSGGHRGLESVAKNIKTEAFARIRVGISPANAKGVVKKPHGEEAVADFILGKFKPKELEVLLKNTYKKVDQAITLIIEEGIEKATGKINGLK